MPRSPAHDDPRFVRARVMAGRQGGVLSRRQLYALGLTRWEVRGQLRARRWQALSDQAICLHNGPVERLGQLWAAVLHGGARACLDGAASLEAAGLKRYDERRIRVSVPRGVKVRRTPLFDVRQTRRWRSEDIVTDGLRRTRAPVAAVHAALWAVSDRQAAYVLSATVQQELASPEELGLALLQIRRARRRLLLNEIVNDLLDGARALGELDFARECRRRHLPKPDRQVLRQDKRKRYYLDVYWDAYDVVVEIDGIHHTWAENIVGDALRQNFVAIKSTMLRLPLLGLRLEPDAFFEQIAQALRLAAPLAS